LKDLGVDERIILKRYSRSGIGVVWTEFIWLGIRTDDGAFECGNKTSGSIK